MTEAEVAALCPAQVHLHGVADVGEAAGEHGECGVVLGGRRVEVEAVGRQDLESTVATEKDLSKTQRQLHSHPRPGTAGSVGMQDAKGTVGHGICMDPSRYHGRWKRYANYACHF